ncbi:hypothetical protein BBJ28_00018835 [Nothophytophthora sp. Chile5]|nr:hypothetical protein BBJ28_00018835 [Nothophytophthora sp. Chile5]
MTGENAAALPLVGKKLMNRLGAMANEGAAAEVSAFARRQMEKMGWSAGKGLGKQEQGVVSHIKVKKRAELQGVGAEKVQAEEHKSQWWYGAYDRVASKIQLDVSSSEDEDDSAEKKAKKQKKKDKKKKDKKRKRTAVADDQPFRVPTDEELFAATGGKLFGRRAYGSCAGKLKRDELHVKGKLSSEKKAKKKVKSADDKDETPATTSSDVSEEAEEEQQAKQRKRAKKAARKLKKQQQKDDAAV